MILAAGRGERMRPLTEHTPKPLLQVAGVPLIEHHLRRLAEAGFVELVINVSHLGQQLIDYCGDGARWGLHINWSREETPLETAGGLVQALPALGDAPFLVVNADIWIDYPFAELRAQGCGDALVRLVLVDNPPQHPEGDFRLERSGRERSGRERSGLVRARNPGEKGLTYAGLGVYSPRLLAGLEPGFAPLRPLLDRAIAAGEVTGEHYAGEWQDIGTPERLAALDRMVRDRGAPAP